MARKLKAQKTLKEKFEKNSKELIPYIDYLTDPRKLEVAKILAYHGYRKGADRYSYHGAINASARAIGVNRNTILYWLKDEQLNHAVDEIRARMIACALNGMLKLAEAKDFGACAFLLERLDPQNFSNDYKRAEFKKEYLKLETEIRQEVSETFQIPSITIEPMRTPEYERNKIDE